MNKYIYYLIRFLLISHMHAYIWTYKKKIIIIFSLNFLFFLFFLTIFLSNLKKQYMLTFCKNLKKTYFFILIIIFN